MSITTLEGYVAAAKQRVRINKTSVSTFSTFGGTAGVYNDGWDKLGDPGAGSLSIGSKTAGVVPTASTTGAPTINPFSGTAYLTGVEATFIGYAQGAMMRLHDRLFHCGSYVAGDGTQTLAAQPSFSARLPGGSYYGLELFVESTSSTVIQPFTVTYTDQAGNTGHSTTFTPKSTSQSGYMMPVPLASGDCGIQKIESVAVAATGGGFNLVIARPLFKKWIPSLGYNSAHQATLRFGLEQLGMPQVFVDSCLWVSGSFGGSNGSGEFLLELSAA